MEETKPAQGLTVWVIDGLVVLATDIVDAYAKWREAMLNANG